METKSTMVGPDDADDKIVRDQPLQAVVLADDWKGTSSSPEAEWGFQPLLYDRPKVLSPLLDRPMIDYVVSYLSSQGVHEVFVVCVTKDVEDYVKEANSLRKLGVKITVVQDGTISNAGDALRELDKRSVVESNPFILIHGDTITNVDLSEAIEAHVARQAEDSSAILTMILKTPPNHRSCLDDLIVGVDPNQSDRILLYGNDAEECNVTIPCSFFSSHCTSLVVHTDLLDAGIDICSTEVLLKFSDEFDYRHIRSQFVANAVAEEEEGLVSRRRLFGHFE